MYVGFLLLCIFTFTTTFEYTRIYMKKEVARGDRGEDEEEGKKKYIIKNRINIL